MMLYHEGWGVESLKHSQTYSGGLSRAYTRTYMSAWKTGFEGFSPFTLPSVIRVSEAIPFVELTNYDAEKLYALKGLVVAAGIRHIAGVEMPVSEKRRFQEGALPPRELEERLPVDKPRYRRLFDQLWESPPRRPVPAS
jgi:asparagine synthase (glutamine-hydrolysing)